jgi:hypothetical protein
MIVPGPPRHLLATSFLSQQLRTIIVIIQTNHGSLKSSQSLPDRLALLQDHQLCSRYTQTNPGYAPCLLQLLQTITTVTHHSRTTLDQSKPPRPLQKTRTYSWTTSTVPNQPRPFLVTPYLSQPVPITNAISRHSIPTMDHTKLHRAFLID